MVVRHYCLFSPFFERNRFKVKAGSKVSVGKPNNYDEAS
jgi:hypothetical protein